MKTNRNLTARYALIQTFLWAEFGFMFSYGNQYLTERLHLTDTAAGLVLGIATGLSFLLQPPLTALAERTETRRVLVLAAGCSAACALATLLPLGTAATVVLFALACVALQVMPSFSNALGMAGIRSGQTINFGLARGIGSCFGLGARAAAPLIGWMGRQAIPLSGAVMALGVAVSVLLFPAADGQRAVQSAEKPDNAREFLRGNRRFLVLLVGIVLIYIGHNALSNCMFRIAQSKIPDGAVDAATDLQGTALLIAALVELPTMFLFTRLLRRVRCDVWLVLSGAFMTLRLALTWLVPSAVGLCLAQVTQMLGYALLAVSSVYYVGTVIDRRNVVKGQTYLGSANTLGCLLAYVLGGVLIDGTGVNGMLIFCLVLSVVGLVLTLLSRERVERTAGVN